MRCKTMKRYSGNRMDVIRRMINDKLCEEERKKFSEVSVSRKFAARIGTYKQLRKTYNDELELKKDEISGGLAELNADWDSYNPVSVKIFFNRHKCYVPDKDLDELQRAVTLYDLGKRKEASEICDGLIDKYGLRP